MVLVDYWIASRSSNILLPAFVRRVGGLADSDMTLLSRVAAGGAVSRRELRRAMAAYSIYWIVAGCIALAVPLVVVLPLSMLSSTSTQAAIVIGLASLFVFIYAGVCLIVAYLRLSMLPAIFGLENKSQPPSESNFPFGMKPKARDGIIAALLAAIFCVVSAVSIYQGR